MKQTTTKKPIKKSSTSRRKKPLNRWGRLKRRIKLLFIPHRSNQYRPHVIRRYGLMVVIVLAVGMQLGYNVATTGRVLGQHEPVSTIELLADTNAQRVKAGLVPLRIDNRLSQAAYLKAQDMFDKQYWAHQAPDGTTPWYWFGLTGYDYAYAGENLAKNFVSADAATVAWMTSPDHRANILDPNYTQAGFAVVDGLLHGKPTSVIVALYGEPAGGVVVAGSAVAGAHKAALIVDAPAPHSLGLMARIGVAAQSVSPAAIGGMVLVIIVSMVAVTAHAYRRQLPKTLRQSWYRHHGAIKAGGMLSLSVVMLLLYSGGQI